MSRISPLGPFETPAGDIIARSDPEARIFGPGHGNVFSPDGTDDCYFVYLEYGRGGVTRQVCIDRMEFYPDGRIKPVKLTTAGIEALDGGSGDHQALIGGLVATASSVLPGIDITA